jgi:hypothetical protein
MSLTLKNVAAASLTYSPLRTEGNRTTYIGSAHTDIVKDQVIVTSTPPKRSANSYGNRRASINLVRTITVDTPDGGTASKDLKVELVASLPAGLTNSEAEEAFASAVSLAFADFADIAIAGKTQL